MRGAEWDSEAGSGAGRGGRRVGGTSRALELPRDREKKTEVSGGGVGSRTKIQPRRFGNDKGKEKAA